MPVSDTRAVKSHEQSKIGVGVTPTLNINVIRLPGAACSKWVRLSLVGKQ